MTSPLLTKDVDDALREAARAGRPATECSLDLGRSRASVELHADGWTWQGGRYPFIDKAKDRTVYYWDGSAFQPASRFTRSLVKLVPTEWGAPTFEIDGIKMLPTSQVSPYEDARRKVELIQPRGKTILDTCGGLGYFAAWCLEGGAARVLSFEKSEDVIWLRGLNPWSPPGDARLELAQGDITEHIRSLAPGSVDAILHDPPRFGIAGELYSQSFYDQLARVLVRKGRLFHYTGTPNKLTTGRDVPKEVIKRLERAGFDARPEADGVLALAGH